MAVVVITDDRHQRFAFEDTLCEYGFVVMGCYNIAQSMPSLTQLGHGLLWLIDVPFEESLQNQVWACQPMQVLMGFSRAPSPSRLECYKRWQKRLIRQIYQQCHLPVPSVKQTVRYNRRWHYVLLLGASMGGIDAIQSFLGQLSDELPLTIVVAHHFDGTMLHTLPKILTPNDDWKCQIITKNQSLRAGQCFIVPTAQQVIFDSEGRVRLLDEPWQASYRPNIGMILKNMSDVYGDKLIAIILSGMGKDGSQYLTDIAQNGSHLWAQSPQSCCCASQPQAMIDSGFCEFVGSPLELAGRVNELLK